MSTQQQIQAMLENMNTKDIRILAKYFDHTITKQSGGYKTKHKLIYNLVGGMMSKQSMSIIDPEENTVIDVFTNNLLISFLDYSEKVGEGTYGTTYIVNKLNLQENLKDTSNSIYDELQKPQYVDVEEIVIKKVLIIDKDDKIKTNRNKTRVPENVRTHSHYFIKLYNEFTFGNISYLFLEKADKSLDKLIKDVIITPDIAMHITIQLCQAVHVLHSMGFENLNLKPENIMFIGSHLKLINFGRYCHNHKNYLIDLRDCNHIKQDDLMLYMAPEFLINNLGKSILTPINYKAVDGYSVGCIIMEIIFKFHWIYMVAYYRLYGNLIPKGTDDMWLRDLIVNHKLQYGQLYLNFIIEHQNDKLNANIYIVKTYQDLINMIKREYINYQNLIDIAVKVMAVDPTKRWNFNKIKQNYKIQIHEGNAQIVKGSDNTWETVLPADAEWKMK